LFSWDQSSQRVALRPEGTAGVLRSIIAPSKINFNNENVPMSGSQRIFYAGEMFRHERPQKGRYRQFSQLGIEWVGDGAAGSLADIQILSMAYHYLSALKIPFQLKINSIGSFEDRKEYSSVLRKYFQENDSELSEYSRKRVETGNVLRILDSKDVGDKMLSKSAPSILDYLSPRSQECFDEVKQGLEELSIPYSIDYKLVRGLDYYNDVIFEFIHSPIDENSSKLGMSQDTILAGGRYDSLCSILGGPATAAVGLVLFLYYYYYS